VRKAHKPIMDAPVKLRAEIALAALRVASAWFDKSSPSGFNWLVADLIASLEKLRALK
jgi:hypothetical protein